MSEEIQHPRSRIQVALVWLIPVLAVLFTILLGAFIRLTIGPTDEQNIYYGTKPFVPGESPYSTGPDSR